MFARRGHARSGGGTRGQALVEFVFIAPLLFLMIFGLVELVRLFQAWQTVQHAAEEGARFAVTGVPDCPGITGDRPACIAFVAKRSTTGLFDAGTSGTATSTQLTSWQFPTYSGSGAVGDAGGPCDAVELQVRYKHKFVLPLFAQASPNGIQLTGRQRMLNEPYGVC